jgi:DNA invertase Pin-like site-specific DNA recombinase
MSDEARTTRAAVYARKSTEQGGSPEARSVARQVAGARAWVAGRGWTLDDAHVYEDDGVSGALFLGRPEFQRMLRAAEAGAFQALVLYDLDRFGRDGRRTMEALHALADAGVTVWDYSTGQPEDLNTFEGRIKATLRAEFAQQYRDTIRKKTRDALRAKAGRGEVTGPAPYGYRNVLEGECKTIAIEEAEAAVVRDIYTRFAAGQGVTAILRWLNRAQVEPPRGDRGWTSTTVRVMLRRPLYRGELVYGRSAMAYGRETGKPGCEEAQVPRPEDEWVRVPRPELRIVPEDLTDRVDARLAEGRETYLASRAAGRAPHKGKGHYLLSGGLLKCPDCGGNFEARHGTSWGGRGVYTCASRRHAPGSCTNTLALPIDLTDDAVLDVLEDEVLGERYIRELLTLVEAAPADEGTRLEAERDRLRGEVDHLLEVVAAGVPAATAAPKIKEREAEIAKLEAALSRPRPVPIDRERLRAALEQRTTEWRSALRAEPEVARVILRRLVGPITLHHEPAPPWVREARERGDVRGLPEGLHDAFDADHLPAPGQRPEHKPEAVLTWGADVKPEALTEGLDGYPVSPSRRR